MRDFDPSEHNVDEVKQYVEDNPDECDRVLTSEEEGKSRGSLVAWLRQHKGDTEEGDVPDETDLTHAEVQQMWDEGEPEEVRVDPNSYPDPENLPHTP